MKVLFLSIFSSVFSLMDWSLLLVFSTCALFILFLNNGTFSCSGFFLTDGISYVLVTLTFWLITLCFLSSIQEKWDWKYFSSFFLLLNFILVFLLASFTTVSFIIFYISFEFIFIMMLIFILGWGFSKERLQASFYMMFYTLVVSFPCLIYFIHTGFESNTFGFSCKSDYWWFFLFLVFLVKLPVFGTHLWLPKAHVEAPVSGSMILAGVLLKLGGYGLVRFMLDISKFLMKWGSFIFCVGLLGGLFSCFVCMQQTDMKALIAYSSICHMSFMLAGLVSFSSLGYYGGIMMMIAHGLCSSCLFFVLYVLYERMKSRSLFVLKGLLLLSSIFSLWWFVTLILNMGVPPFLSFFSEVSIIMGVGLYHPTCYLTTGIFLFMTGLYCIYLFSFFSHGTGLMSFMLMGLHIREYVIILAHVLPSILLTYTMGEYFW